MEFINVIIYISIYLGLIATSFFILSYISGTKKKKLLFTDKELPNVSIIIPAYNEEKSIARTIKSILSSNYPKEKFEIIVVDDGSTDRTFEIAKRSENKGVRVFSKENGGKGSALNFGIKRCNGEIVFSMDADTFVNPSSVKNMTRYFKNEKVMSVTPAIVLHKPKGILQRIQQIEYLSGIFLRKAFSSVNAVHITPGAFSAYRKSFFDKYGGYDEKNITEDLELSLRIQFNNYVIENSLESPVYTIAPRNFFSLLKQRRRWYVGLMKNTWDFRKIFSPKYGDLGMFVFPIAWISILLSVIFFVYLAIKSFSSIQNELLFLSNINFDFGNFLDIGFYNLERFFFLFISNPFIIFLSFFLGLLGFYIFFGIKKVKKYPAVFISLPLFFMFFALLFGFWWVVSIIYLILNRKISWR